MFKVNPKIKWRWENNDVLLLNTIVGLNRTAGEALELCKSVNTTEGLALEMHKKYPKTTLQNMVQDMSKLVSMLERMGVLVPEDWKEPNTGPVAIPSGCMDYIFSKFNDELSAPIGTACILTYACNQRCMHCYTSSPKRPLGKELSTQEWQNLIDEMCNMKVFNTVFAGGEPLLRPDLEDLVHHAATKGLRPAIASNALLLNEEKIEDLKRAGIQGFLISLDGADPQTHDTFRGVKESFKRTIESISIIVDKQIDIAVLTVITKMNLHQIPDIMDLLSTLGVTRHSLVKLRPAGRIMENMHLNPSPEDYIQLLPKIYAKKQALKKLTVLYPDLPAAFFEKSIGLEVFNKLKKTGRIELCGAGIIGCAIGPEGDVRPCDVSDVNVGNVRRQSLEDIWRNAPLFKKLRRLKRTEVVPCKACRLSATCLTGCRALPSQVNEGGDLQLGDLTRIQCFETFRGQLEV